MKNKIKTGVSESLSEFKEPMVSLFGYCFSSISTERIPITKFLLTEKYKNQVETYRKSKDEAERRKIKTTLECITPSSRCNYRQESYFKEYPISQVHTGLICIDIDSKHNPDVDLISSKHLIGENCSSLYYGGLSIGGEGIFLIFRISNPEFHKQHFNALVYYLKEKFNLNVDRAVQNPVSLRVASYDSNPYYNPNPTPFIHTMEIKDSPMPIDRTESQKRENREYVENAVSLIQTWRIDITNRYLHWFKIGRALAHEFGEEGRKWFHMVSSVYKNYDECLCDFEYDKCLKYKKENVKIATFFYYCKQNGVRYWVKNNL